MCAYGFVKEIFVATLLLSTKYICTFKPDYSCLACFEQLNSSVSDIAKKMTPEDKLVMEKTFQMLDEDKVFCQSYFSSHILKFSGWFHYSKRSKTFSFSGKKGTI